MRTSLVIAAFVTMVAASMDTAAQDRARTAHTIFLSVVEIKGGTTVDKLTPPAVNPKDISKGYEFKGPGAADKTNPQRWEVSSYLFSPSHVTVRQEDEVVVTAFVVNGDEHEVWVNAPDGSRVVPKTTWQRGREYRLAFVAGQPGAYQLLCSNHAPSMVATFYALPG
jgi:plastocyanin